MERDVNASMTLCNGFTPEEQLEGLHFEIADWHAGNKAIGVRKFEIKMCITEAILISKSV